MLSIRQPLIPMVRSYASTFQVGAHPTLIPLMRKAALVVTVTVKVRPVTVVVPIPWPCTLMFLFVHDTLPDEQLPAPMLMTSVSAAALTAVCKADVIVPEHATGRTVPVNCAAAGLGRRARSAPTRTEITRIRERFDGGVVAEAIVNRDQPC